MKDKKYSQRLIFLNQRLIVTTCSFVVLFLRLDETLNCAFIAIEVPCPIVTLIDHCCSDLREAGHVPQRCLILENAVSFLRMTTSRPLRKPTYLHNLAIPLPFQPVETQPNMLSRLRQPDMRQSRIPFHQQHLPMIEEMVEFKFKEMEPSSKKWLMSSSKKWLMSSSKKWLSSKWLSSKQLQGNGTGPLLRPTVCYP